MTTFLLIRHALNDYVIENRLAGHLPGIHLNEKGITQAEHLSESLQKLPIRAIYSSPLERALETAETVAIPHQLPLVEREGLIEVD